MTEQEGELVGDPALPVEQIGMANPACLHLHLDQHQRLTPGGVRHQDGLHRDRGTPGDDGACLVCHCGSPH
ncbi:hypothetical protein GCM10010279_61080 [Streptomyces mutabilis]|nr:hypothetical protein GCM10010279_61080 [Streptomyces mutabilis]